MKTKIKRHLVQRVDKLRTKSRLEQIRTGIENECVSYNEILFLQNNTSHIDENDVLLLEWAGVDENYYENI